MAIGAVVSHRNFGSFIGSGCLCHSFGSFIHSSQHVRVQTNIDFYRTNSNYHLRVYPSHQPSKSSNLFNTRRRTRGLCHCCLSSAHSDGIWVQPRKLDSLCVKKLVSKHSIVTRTRADFKSEVHDITEGEAVLVEGPEQKKSWWKQFPKRWVMVLLCFASFLLCNMDHVNMSIAILPMSKEFN